jgi:alanine-alpha-ketoisovalerate/valine-pyruvate aminotransferase
VILFEPAYDCYGPDTLLAGGTPRFVRLDPPPAEADSSAAGPADWTFDPAALRAAFGPKTRAIVINTPHNPTGKVFTRAELELIAELCIEYDVIAVAVSEAEQGTNPGVVFDHTAVQVPEVCPDAGGREGRVQALLVLTRVGFGLFGHAPVARQL